MFQVKTKIQSVVLAGMAGLFFIFTSATIYLFYEQAREKNLAYEQMVKQAEQGAIIDLDRYLFKRIEAMLKSEPILKAFQNRDRKELLRLTEERFKVIESELPGPAIFHFHTPDTVSFLRVHFSEHHSDDLLHIRPMIAEANRRQQITRGFEAGRYSVSYRVAVPVTFQEQHLGVLEIGTGVEYIVESIHDHFSLHAALYLDSDVLGYYEKEKGASTIFGEEFVLSKEVELFSPIKHLKTTSERKILINRKWYRIHSNNLITNFQGEHIGTLVFLQDVDREYKLLIRAAVGTIFLAMIILALVWLSINKFMGKMIDDLIASEQKLQSYSDELETKVARRTEDLTLTNEKLQYEIKERLEAAKTLLKNQQLLRAILDNSPTFIYCKDLRGKYSLVNARFAELLSLDYSEIIGKTDYELFPKEVADVFQENDRKVMDNESTIQVEEVITLNDGRHTYITSKFPLYDDKAIFYGIAAILTDITERKKLEEDISMFKTFTDSSSEGMGWTGIDGTLIYTNLALAKLLGEKDKKAALGKNVAGYYPDYEQQRLRDEIFPIVLQDGSWSGELMLQQPNGKIVATHNSVFLITNEAFEPAFYANIVIDITERKQVEEQIKKSLHEKEVLLKEIHHRVKNNLQVASSILYLQAKKVGDEDLQQILLDSRDRIKSMALVHETLYQSGDLSRVDLAKYIQTLVQHVFRTYKNRSREIIPKINIENITLSIDTAIPCGLIINELISNSFKYAFPEKNGEIHVTMLKEEDHFVLTVSDNGIGLPEDMDLQNSKSVGLKLVTSLVKQLSGTLEICRNQGTQFTIIFAEPTYSPRI